MTHLTVDKDELRKFIQSFGHNVHDLMLTARDFSLIGAVAMPTHFFTQRISATIEDSGAIFIDDITSVVSFLRACDGNVIELKQKTSQPLHLSCGNITTSLPSSGSPRSAKNLTHVLGMVTDATDNDWKMWAGESLNCYGRLADTVDLVPVSRMGNVVGKDTGYRTTFKDGALVIEGGKKGSSSMSIALDLMDTDCPPTDTTNLFGPWFSLLINGLPQGPCEIYTGAGSVMVLNHVEKESLLVLIPQGGE